MLTQPHRLNIDYTFQRHTEIQPVIDSFIPEHERRPLDIPASLPDLTGRIVKLGEQYVEAGGYGDIYKCQYNSEDGVKEVAVKTFRFKFSVMEFEKVGSGTNKMIRRELGIWRRLSHPNIVPFLGIVYGFGREASASLVALWMPNGTLSSFLTEHEDRLTVTERFQLLLGVANGLVYLHSFLIVHGDLSCNNVLVDQDGTARLADFGYASLVGEIPEALAYLHMSTTKPGAIRWAAPEHFSLTPGESIQRTTKSDIYSFGNIAFMVLSGKPPWSEHHDMAVTVLLHFGHKPNRPQSPPIEDEHWGLIEHCWSSVHSRPHASDVVCSLQRFLSPISTITPPWPHASTFGTEPSLDSSSISTLSGPNISTSNPSWLPLVSALPPTPPSGVLAPTSPRMYNGRELSIRSRRFKKDDEDYIKRPENAFLLFRRKCCEERQLAQKEVHSLGGPAKRDRQAVLSKTISQEWKALSPEERLYWEELAKEKKKEHEQIYPSYIYRPQRTKKDRNRKKSKRGEEGDSDSTSLVDFPSSASAERYSRASSVPVSTNYQTIQIPSVNMPSCPTSPSLLATISPSRSPPDHGLSSPLFDSAGYRASINTTSPIGLGDPRYGDDFMRIVTASTSTSFDDFDLSTIPPIDLGISRSKDKCLSMSSTSTPFDTFLTQGSQYPAEPQSQDTFEEQLLDTSHHTREISNSMHWRY